MAEYLKNCNYCKKEFKAQKRTTRFCSLKCAQRGYKLARRMDADDYFADQETMKITIHKLNLTLERIEFILERLPNNYVLSEKKLLTPKEASKFLGKSYRTILRMIDNGELKIRKIGKSIFINRNQITKP